MDVTNFRCLVSISLYTLLPAGYACRSRTYRRLLVENGLGRNSVNGFNSNLLRSNKDHIMGDVCHNAYNFVQIHARMLTRWIEFRIGKLEGFIFTPSSILTPSWPKYRNSSRPLRPRTTWTRATFTEGASLNHSHVHFIQLLLHINDRDHESSNNPPFHWDFLLVCQILSQVNSEL